MQPERNRRAQQTARDRADIMEAIILGVRRLWFGSEVRPLDCATSVIEPGGELVMLVDGDGAAADRLISDAARRGAYVMVTSHSRPFDLDQRLARGGYRMVQRQSTYLFEPEIYHAAPEPRARVGGERRTLLDFLRRRAPLDLTVRTVSEEELPVWNDVCWRAFGMKGSPEVSLGEKRRAYRMMGANARWYLAFQGGRPVGTAILYQTEAAAQVLAVGTLPSARGRGVARTVLHRLIRDWEQDGHGFLFLDTNPGGEAERLYLRLGFRAAYLRDLYAPWPLP